MARVRNEREAAIAHELEEAATAYETARVRFETARQRYEATRERLIGVRRFAAEVLTAFQMAEWQAAHPTLEMVGQDIKGAILSVLRTRAHEVAKAILQNGKKFLGAPMGLHGIVDALDKKGFEWRTATPRREVHATLLHLKGITKITSSLVQIAEADEIYQHLKEVSKMDPDTYWGVGELSEGEPVIEQQTDGAVTDNSVTE